LLLVDVPPAFNVKLDALLLPLVVVVVVVLLLISLLCQIVCVNVCLVITWKVQELVDSFSMSADGG
jgi:hypothetical protein